jgi:hypothetical protein
MSQLGTECSTPQAHSLCAGSTVCDRKLITPTSLSSSTTRISRTRRPNLGGEPDAMAIERRHHAHERREQEKADRHGFARGLYAQILPLTRTVVVTSTFARRNLPVPSFMLRKSVLVTFGGATVDHVSELAAGPFVHLQVEGVVTHGHQGVGDAGSRRWFRRLHRHEFKCAVKPYRSGRHEKPTPPRARSLRRRGQKFTEPLIRLSSPSSTRRGLLHPGRRCGRDEHAIKAIEALEWGPAALSPGYASLLPNPFSRTDQDTHYEKHAGLYPRCFQIGTTRQPLEEPATC